MARAKLSNIEIAIQGLETSLQALKAEYEVLPQNKTYSVIVTIELNIMELKKLQAC